MQYQEYSKEVAGSRMAVLMLHGIVGTPNHFKDLLPLIPADWSVYNILLDGHGGQIRDFAHTSMKKWRAQVQSQLEYIFTRHEKLIIVGHSMGSLFAIDAAVRYPDKVVHLFCHGIPMVVHTPLSTSISTLRVIFDKVKPGTVAAEMQADCGVHLTKNLFQYIPTIPRLVELLQEIHRVRKLLPQLQVPCRSFLGIRDELVSRRSSKYLVCHPAICHVILPHSGHFCFAPEDLPQVLAAFTEMTEIYR